MIPAAAVDSERHGRRDRAQYRQYYRDALRKLQAQEYLSRQRAFTHSDYCTTYEDRHGRPGFEPAVEREMREGAKLAELHPLDESVLSVWYCRQRAAAVRGAALAMVTPDHCASQPFRRTAAFTTPTHLSMHESPVEQQRAERPLRAARVELLDRLQLQGWRLGTAGPVGAPDPAPHRYPMADVFADVGKKYWSDRREYPVRPTESEAHAGLRHTPSERDFHLKPYG